MRKAKKEKLTVTELEAKIYQLRHGKPVALDRVAAPVVVPFKIRFPGPSGIRKSRYGKVGNYYKLIFNHPKS